MLVLHPFAVAGTVVSGQQEWGAFPVLRRDVSAESLHVRTGGEKPSEFLFHSFQTLKTRKWLERGSDEVNTAGLGKKCSGFPRQLFSAPGQLFD